MLDHQLYFTFSSADMHRPELHALFGGEMLNAWKILSSFGCIIHWMQSGTGTDLNTKQGEVFMAIELLN